tara:strand:+ start:60 stop:1499 length:1440 start_codon:yes stop_codon:yes gene_type:complete
MDPVDSISEEFFQHTNFEMITSVIEVDFKTRFNKDINDECPDLKSIVFQTMVNIFDNSLDEEKKLEILNKKTLTGCLPDILHNIKKMNKTQEEQKVTKIEEIVELNQKDMATPIDNLETVEDVLIPDAIDNNISDLVSKKVSEPISENVINTSINELENDKQIEKNLIVEQLVTKIKDLPQTDYEKEYIDKIVAIEINSRDRKDIDVGNDNAYSFSVKFDSGENHKTIGLSEGIKNIVKVTLSHIIIPNIGNNISRYPYLYLEIPEFPGQFIGSSEYSSRAFAKIIRDKDWAETSNSNITFFCMYDKFSNGWISETPIASIPKISVNILTPRGELIPTLPDTFTFKKITCQKDNNNITSFTIETNEYFDNDFLAADHIITFHNIVFSSGTENISIFKNFLENKEGHVIDSTSDSNKVTFSNLYKFDTETGNKIYENYGLGNTSVYNINSGTILNSSKQTSVCFHCTTRNYKNSTVSQIV